VGSILAETCPALVGDNTWYVCSLLPHWFFFLNYERITGGTMERRRIRADISYTTYVINDAGSTYSNAYFELNYINVFSSSPSTTSSSAKTSATGATTTISTGPGSTTTAPVRAGNGGSARVGSSGGLVVAALVGSLLLL
jgi:hypothetical protein